MFLLHQNQPPLGNGSFPADKWLKAPTGLGWRKVDRCVVVRMVWGLFWMYIVLWCTITGLWGKHVGRFHFCFLNSTWFLLSKKKDIEPCFFFVWEGSVSCKKHTVVAVYLQLLNHVFDGYHSAWNDWSFRPSRGLWRIRGWPIIRWTQPALP